MPTISRATLPELLHREDTSTGRWTIGHCGIERGAPRTSVSLKQMFVPHHDLPVARVVRAHEMMHAKVSPGDEFLMWVARGFASEKALRSVEELRVNFLCRLAGFPMLELLTDMTEYGSGKRMASMGDWADAVLYAVALRTTAGYAMFIDGVKSENPDWVEPLDAITKKCLMYMKGVRKEQLSATTDFMVGIAPDGFAVTEKIAAWLDGIIGASSSEADKPIKVDTVERSKIGPYEDDDEDGDNNYYGRDPISYSGAWGVVNVGHALLDMRLRGSLAKTRRASDTGRNPRRIGRVLTDPQRRIFDTKRSTMGGVVLIDASGSMHFNESDIEQIVLSAPSSIVAMYAEDEDGSSGRDNLVVLAKEGRYASNIPNRQQGNNIDLPALEWAVQQRKTKKTPVIWVTDGGVTGTSGETYDQLGVQCVQFCKKHNVFVVENQRQLRELLDQLKAGKNPTKNWPAELIRMYRSATGQNLLLT